MKPLSRRAFLYGLAGAVAVAGCGGDSSSLPVVSTGVPAPASDFPLPLSRRSVNGLLDTSLDVRFAPNTLGARSIVTRTFEGTIPGPTLRLQPGDQLKLRLSNSLPQDNSSADVCGTNFPHGFNALNLHTHGLHVSPRQDDVFLEIEPGESYDYTFDIPIDHPPGTYWYHTHKHGSVAIQLLSGMAGAIIIEGDIDKVPEIAAASERLMMIQELRIDEDGRVWERFSNNGELNTLEQSDTIWSINGAVQPTLRMAPGEVQRWRLIFGGMANGAELRLDDHAFHQLAFDGITFPQLETVPDALTIAPGNRVDVLVRAGDVGTYDLVLTPVQPGEAALQLPPAVILKVEVSGDPVSMALPSGPLPAPASLPPITDDELTGSRTLVLAAMQTFGQPCPVFTIDGNLFNPDRVDHTVRLGDVEEWTITNPSGWPHPFHIHTNPYALTHVNGIALPRPVWQDTTLIPPGGSITFRTRFEDFRGKFVLHCHFATHEDMGMMQVVEVV